jgi:hypothetical protein
MDVEVLQGSGKPLFSTFLHFSPLCAGGRLRSCSQKSGQSDFPAISRIFRRAKWMWKSCKDPGNHFSQLFSTFRNFVLAGGFGVVARYLGKQIFRPFLEFSGVRDGCGSLPTALSDGFAIGFVIYWPVVGNQGGGRDGETRALGLARGR